MDLMEKPTAATLAIIWRNKENNEVITKGAKSYFLKDKTGTMYSMGNSLEMLKGMLTLLGRPDVAKELIQKNIL